jgi:hypothetical protein
MKKQKDKRAIFLVAAGVTAIVMYLIGSRDPALIAGVAVAAGFGTAIVAGRST